MGFWQDYHDNGALPNLWKGFTGQMSAEKQNEENLQFQREKLEYEKQLQQQIFEREDTAYQRSAQDAQAVGINPMAMTGLNGSGEAVPTTLQQSNVDYSQFGMAQNLPNLLSMASGVASAVNEYKTGNSQRDLLESQKTAQDLKNEEQAIRNKFLENSLTYETNDKKSTSERNERVNHAQEVTGTTDQSGSIAKGLQDIVNIMQTNKEGKNNKPHVFFDALHSVQDAWQKHDEEVAKKKEEEENAKRERREKVTNQIEGFFEGLSDSVSENVKSLQKKMSEKRRNKRIKNKHAKYYSDKVRNYYVQQND